MIATDTFILETDFTINYTTRKRVPIADIVDSLKSLEKLIHRTPVFVEKAYHGIRIIDVEVYVDYLQAGSLKEKFFIKFIFKNQVNYDKAKEVVEKVLEDNTVIRTAVAIGIGALTTYGVMSAMGPSAPSKHIEVYNNTIVNVGGVAKLTADDITTILEGITDKKQLAKTAIDVIKPAKSDPDSTIEIAGISALTMNKEYIRDVPEEYVPPTPDEREDKYSNVDVLVYASDREKSDSTWAGIVPGVVDKRVKFILGEGIDPLKLHGRTKIKADITVMNVFNKTKKIYESKSVLIRTTN